MAKTLATLQSVIDLAKTFPAVRVAVCNAAQKVVLETLRQALDLGIARPILIGDATAIRKLAASAGLKRDDYDLVDADGDVAVANIGVQMVRDGRADVLMKGLIHTDSFMRAILDSEHGMRVPGQRVSHAFLCEVPLHEGLLVITDAAINISPDLNAKAQILQNAIALLHWLGVAAPKVAVLSAVETVNPAIASTLDAACLTLMAQRGQITGALVDGPLAFDNAVSRGAADEKGITSSVSGGCDIMLVPDLVSGNILAKTLEYLANAVAAGIVLGLNAPVVLSSRSDPAPARLAALALAVLIHHRLPNVAKPKVRPPETSLEPVPQVESACCPLPS
jgi:phosphotransacetylase